MGRIVIEIDNGKIIGVYGSDEMEVIIYEDLNINHLSSKGKDVLDEVVASVPYILYPKMVKP